MRNYIEIGEAPCDEACVQVSHDGEYLTAMRDQCVRFIKLIRKKLGPEPPGALLSVQTTPAVFGTYLQCVCSFDKEDDEAVNYAELCESEAPRTWQDDQPIVKKQYSVVSSLRCWLTLTVEAESKHMAEVRAEVQVRDKAKKSGFELEHYYSVWCKGEEVVAGAGEIKPPNEKSWESLIDPT